MGFTRQVFGVALGVLSVLALGTACSETAESPRPNVLFVSLDTTRADFLSCYGSKQSSTPAIDALAEDGVRFAQANTSSAVTPVSHATMLTGKYQHNHGLRVISAESAARLNGKEWYLPEALKQAGYSTAAVHSAFPVSRKFGFDRAFDEFHGFDATLKVRDGDRGTAWNVARYQRRSDETTDLAIEVADRLAEPFFMWVHYWDPHDDMQVPTDEFLEEQGVSSKKKSRQNDELYAAEVTYMDREFGRLLEHLKATGRYENTVVALTADHGEGLSDGLELHGWGGHRMLYREQVHVPLIFRFPADLEVPKNRVVNELVRTVDISPTLLEYLNIPATTKFDGRSLSSLIRAQPDEARVAFYDQINGYDLNAHLLKNHPEAAFLYTVNDGRWKLIYRPHMPSKSELFAFPADENEQKNLFGKKPAIEQRLLILLAREQPWVTAPFPADGESDDSSETSDALGALGYMESEVSDARWAWTCPVHRTLYFETAQRCEECDELPIPIPAK